MSAMLPIVSEVVNGNWAVLAFILILVCACYIKHEWFANRVWTQGMGIAASIVLLSVGVCSTRAIVFIWRHFYGQTEFTDGQAIGLSIGGAIGAAGFLILIRRISKPLFGDGPWIATLAVCSLFTAYILAGYFAI